MLKNVRTIEELKNSAIAVKSREKVVVFWPQFNKCQEQAYTLEREYFVSERTYNTNNGIIAFYEQGALYVVPYFRKAISVIETAGFEHSDMFVPFSNHEYPIKYKEEWNAMLVEARELQEESYRQDCIKYSAQLGVTPINQDLLDDMCMAIPEEGIMVNNPDKEPERRFPVIAGCCCDSMTVEHLGRYFVNAQSGIITFVNADGKQYITRSETVHKELFKKGYQFSKFTEIFEIGEEPADDEYLDYWKHLTIA